MLWPGRGRPWWAALCVVAWGCAAASDAVRSAEAINYRTSYAHMVLRAGFEHSPADEDDADARLLAQVARLDALDDALPAKVERLNRANDTASASGGPLRREILRDLDSIAECYEEVERALLTRPVHEAVRSALAQVPAEVDSLRTHLDVARPSN